MDNTFTVRRALIRATEWADANGIPTKAEEQSPAFELVRETSKLAVFGDNPAPRDLFYFLLTQLISWESPMLWGMDFGHYTRICFRNNISPEHLWEIGFKLIDKDTDSAGLSWEDARYNKNTK